MNNNYTENRITASSIEASIQKSYANNTDVQTPISGRNYLLSKVREYSNGLVINSTVYKEILRSILSKMKLTYVNAQGENTDIKIHHGRQERLVAKKFQENNLILPYSTIYQSSVASDDAKRKTSSILSTTTEWDDSIRRARRIFHEPDVPVKIEYTLSLWTKYVSDMDQIASKLRSHFNPNMVLETPFSSIIPVFIKEETDNSTTEVLDKEERLVRKNFVLEVQTYIQSPRFLITNTGKITHINTEIWI